MLLVPEDVGVDLVELCLEGLDVVGSSQLGQCLNCVFHPVCTNKPAGAMNRSQYLCILRLKCKGHCLRFELPFGKSQDTTHVDERG